MNTGAGADIHDPVGAHHGLFIVFYDDERVAEVTHVFQRIDQLGIVALMQTDAGLIQNIQNTGKP